MNKRIIETTFLFISCLLFIPLVTNAQTKPFISVTYVDFNIPQGKFIGIVNNRRKIHYQKGKPLRNLGFKNVLHLDAIQGFQKASIETQDETRYRNKISGIYKPKVIVKAVIDSIYFNFSGKEYLDFVGYSEVFGKWKFYNNLDIENAIDSIPFATKEERFKGTKDYILSPPLQLAAEELANNERFKSLFKSIEKDYFNKQRGIEVQLNQPVSKQNGSAKTYIQNAIKAVYTIETKNGFGSAVSVSPDGYLITNYHVIYNVEESELLVTNNIGEEFKPQIIKTNPDFDLALLKLTTDHVNFLKISDRNAVEIGEDVFAIGTPMHSDLSQSVSSGIISGLRSLPYLKVIQTDVSINPGNSGGALMDSRGELIGITTFKISEQSAEGIGFCIPSFELINALNLTFKP